MPIPYFVTALRLLIPLSILKWPLWGVLASSLADMYDWQFVNLKTESDYSLYQNWDKLMDFYYWLLTLMIVSKWKDVLAKKLAFGLFIYRIFGMLFFWLTGKRIFLFLFPNVFENFFIFFLFFKLLFKKERLLTSPRISLVTLSILVIPKLIHEYFMHFLEKQPWEFFDVGKTLKLSGFLAEYSNYFFFGSLLYLIPFSIGLFWTNKLQKSN